VPQGIFERTVAVFIVLVTAGLIVLLVPSWQRYQDRVRDLEADGAPATAPTEVATTTALAEATTTAPLPPAPTTTALAPPRPVRLARLAIAATRGDCWLEVRAGSASGRVLYSGFLSQGDSRPFKARRLWVRLGASGNVDLRLNGRSVRSVPVGTVVLLVGRKGFRVFGTA
jgi:uncharacterized protein YjeT (DUF2065 family)